jgi:hypothetical protein
MSIPNNPLNSGTSSSHRHILIAFEYAEDAVLLKEFDPGSATVGEPLNNKKITGKNVVVVNELNDPRFSIQEAVWDFDYGPSIGISTTASVGKIVVSDRRSPYAFLNFLYDDVVYKFFNTTNKTSLSQVTFVLKTIFSINTRDGSIETIMPAPFYFNVESIESVQSVASETPSNHILKVIGVSNSLGLLPAFSELNQFTITHKDGNIHDRVASSGFSGGGSLSTRSEGNASNRSARKERLDLSKPMSTLQDLFEGFEADLNQQRYAHKGQLQKWIREIRSDTTVDKIIIAPEQAKGPDDDELPITFKIDLDPTYKNYPVDNRNMPFEQPDVIQGNKGIAVFPIISGTSVHSAIGKLMMLSKSIGLDATKAYPTIFKVAITAIRGKEKYEINIKIRKYEIPYNPTEDDFIDRYNTGPGTAKNPLEFNINGVKEKRNVDIVAFKSNITYRTDDVMLEQQNETTAGAGVVFADREQATSERHPKLGFYETLYSGLRNLVAPHSIDGLESAQRAGDIYNLQGVSSYGQNAEYELIIHGNPNLLSDINRNPIDVVNDIDGVFNYYPKPEVDPMYVKLTIFEKSAIDEADINDAPPVFYFDDFYHMVRVVNVFGGNGEDRTFYQYLSLQRTDDLI